MKMRTAKVANLGPALDPVRQRNLPFPAVAVAVVHRGLAAAKDPAAMETFIGELMTASSLADGTLRLVREQAADTVADVLRATVLGRALGEVFAFPGARLLEPLTVPELGEQAISAVRRAVAETIGKEAFWA